MMQARQHVRTRVRADFGNGRSDCRAEDARRMVMAQVSDKLTSFVAAEEGLVLRAYRCPAGVLTIGYGHTSAAGVPRVVAGMTITADEARAILKRDLEKFHRRAATALPYAGRHPVDGATSFDFNTGRVHDATWPKLYRAGDLGAARASLMQWTKAAGRDLPGLRRRREREAALIFDRQWPKEAPEPDTSWREALRALGYADDDAGIRAFQRAHGLTVDGEVGPATRATIRRATDARSVNRASAAGAAPGGGGAAASTQMESPEALVVALILLVAIPAVIWGGGWLWRNRGRFTGRRVWA